MVATGVSWTNPTSEELIRWGAEYGPNTLSGQYWRLLTAAFVHIGIVHIALNMWCLWSLGRLLERLVGSFTTFGIYLVTGVGASLLSLIWDPMRVSAGASGAIFGIAGTLIPVLYYGNLGLPPEDIRKLLGYVVRFSLINLVYGLRGHVNNMAHLGGLVTGLLAGFFLARSFSLPQEERGAQRRNVLAFTALAVVLLVIPVSKAKSYAVELRKGSVSLDRKDFNGAIEHLKKYTAAQPDDAYGHALLGSALHSAKRYDDAAQEYELALTLYPGYGFVEVNLGRVYFALNKPDKAVQMFRAGISHVAADADNYYWYAAALKATGDLYGAEYAARRAIHLNAKDVEAQSLLNEIIKARNSSEKSEIDTHTAVKRKNTKAQAVASQ